MNEEELAKWLVRQWELALAGYDEAPDPEIDRFVHSGVVSVRYAFLTQLLGKQADPARDLRRMWPMGAGVMPALWSLPFRGVCGP